MTRLARVPDGVVGAATLESPLSSHRHGPSYLKACRELLPNSQSVIDRFHVAKKLGEVTDKLRKKLPRLQARLAQGAAQTLAFHDARLSRRLRT